MFSPPLPRAKAAAIAALAIGCVDKMFITFEAGAPAGGCSDGRAASAAARRPAAAPAPAPPRPAAGAGRQAAAPAQRGGAAVPGVAAPEPSAYHTSQGRAVVAFQLLWRSDAAQLGPLAEAPPGGPAARARGAPAVDAPKTWDSASSHLAASGAAELAGPATAARPAANGAAHGAANGAANGAASGAANGRPAAADQAGASRPGTGEARNGHGSASATRAGSAAEPGTPGWIRGIYSLRLWGPEFLPELRQVGDGVSTPADELGTEPAPAHHPAAGGPETAGSPGLDASAMIGTLNVESGGDPGKVLASAADVPGGAAAPGTPRRRGGANAEAAAAPAPAPGAGAPGAAGQACCAVMWITGADAQAMEAASDDEARLHTAATLCWKLCIARSKTVHRDDAECDGGCCEPGSLHARLWCKLPLMMPVQWTRFMCDKDADATGRQCMFL
jgi:hypothetical protein